MNTPLEDIALSLRRIADSLAQAVALPHAATLASGRCWRWQQTPLGGRLHPSPAPLAQALLGVDSHRAAVLANTTAFLMGQPANHVLLTGARGCGKSSLLRSIFAQCLPQGLTLIDTDTLGLTCLPLLLPALYDCPAKVILLCDDLSFTDGDTLFRQTKNTLDAVMTTAGVLVYATSNRRHLIKDQFNDNNDVQPQETQDEKIALADRFGLWLHFYAPDQDNYLAMVQHHLTGRGIDVTDDLQRDALRFADYRGGRSGRVAYQFAASCSPDTAF